MSDDQFDPNEEDDLRSAFRDLGNTLHGLVKNAWESEERLRLQNEIEEGINEMRNSFREAYSGFVESEKGQQIKQDVVDFNQRVKSGEFESKVKQEINKIVRAINQEINDNFPASKETTPQDENPIE
ncbi:MAG: hypothetical protein JXA19_01425 [Anaerolineales bacterium]|nr:hypothetical protein [Anaerolineales bacterium]